MSDAPVPTRRGLDESARSLLTVFEGDRGGERTPLFPSDRAAPRRRRVSDVGRLLAGVAAFALLGWAASTEPDLDARVLAAFRDLPGWIRTLSWVGFTGAGVVVLVIVVAGLRADGVGRGLFRDLLASLAITFVLILVTARVVTGDWPTLLPEFASSTPATPPYPTPRTAFAVVVALVLGGYVNADVQRVLRWSVVASVTTPLLLGLTAPTALFGAVSLGVFSVAVVRLWFGSPEGLPSTERLRSALERLGVPTTDLRYQDDQPGTVGLAGAVASDGRPIRIKVYGVDAARQQRAERVWRSLWYRSAGPSPRSGRSEQAQHEALATLMAREAGVRVPPILGVGQAPGGDVLLVSIGPDGRPLDDPDDETLRRAWRELRALHERAHVTHGDLRAETVSVSASGEVELLDLGRASMFPTQQQVGADIASMIATGAIVAGADRSVAAAVAVVEPADLVAALPFVQAATLDPDLRHRAKDAGVDIDDVRTSLAEAVGADPPELAP